MAPDQQVQIITFIKILFWTIGLIVFTIMTIRGITPLVDEFHNNNIGARIRIVTNNKTVKPPLLVLCIPLSKISLQRLFDHLCNHNQILQWHCDECEISIHEWDARKEEGNFSQNSNATYCYNLNISEPASKKLHTEAIRDVQSFNTSNLTFPFLETVWNLFDCITTMDFTVDYGNYWHLNKCAEYDINLALSNKKVDNLFDLITDILCDYIIFNETGHTCQQLFGDSLEVIYASGFCFQLPASNDFSLIFNSTDSTENDDPFVIIEDLNVVTLSHKYRKTLYTSDSLSSGSELVKLTYSVASIVSEESGVHCYNDSSPTVCQGNCILRKVVQYCACIPFTFRKTLAVSSDHYPYCNGTLYAMCQLNKTEEEQKCLDECSNPCEYTTYHWYVYSNKTFGPGKNFTLDITPIVEPYIEFTAVTKNSPEQLFTQVASVFSLYLGLSGLSVISGALLFLDVILKWHQTRKHHLQNTAEKAVGKSKIIGLKGMFKVSAAKNRSSTEEQSRDLRKRMQDLMEKQKKLAIEMEKLQKALDTWQRI